jgi:hypothetical protein
VNQKDDNIQLGDYLGNHTILHDVERSWEATNVEFLLLDPRSIWWELSNQKLNPHRAHDWSDTGLLMAKIEKVAQFAVSWRIVSLQARQLKGRQSYEPLLSLSSLG